MLEVGSKAPDFTVEDESGNPVTLKDLRGSWVVLWWFPIASSAG